MPRSGLAALVFAALATAAIAAGCVPGQEISFPPGSEGHDVIFVFHVGQRPPELFAVPAGEVSIPLTLPREGLVLSAILLQQGELAARLIDPGFLSLANEDEPRRPLPRGLDFEYAPVDGIGEWVFLDLRPERLDELEIAALDLDRCTALGGCLDPGQPGVCAQDSCASGELELPPLVITPPTRATLPDFSWCRDRWTPIPAASTPTGSVPGCLPAGAELTCPSDQETLFFGETVCRASGTTCPKGQYADDLPPGAILVPPGANTLQAAVESAPDGSTFALARGVYGHLELNDRRVTLIGACTQETILERTGLPDHGVLHLGNGALLARDLTLRGSTSSGIMHSGGELTVARVLIEIGGQYGIASHSSTASISDSVIRGGTLAGVRALASLHLVRSVVERSEGYAFSVDTLGASAFLDRVAVRDSAYHGISVRDGALFSGQDLLVQRTGERGVDVSGLGTTATVRRLAVLDTFPIPRSSGVGIGVTFRAQADFENVVVMRSQEVGVFFAAQSRVRARDLLVRGTIGNAESYSTGITIGGAGAELERVAIDSINTFGISVERQGLRIETSTVSTATISDLTVVEALGTLSFGGGIAVRGSKLLLERGTFLRNSYNAVETHERSTAVLRDLYVEADHPVQEMRPLGSGFAFEGGTISLTRALVASASCYGLLAREDPLQPTIKTTATVRELAIRGIRPCSIVQAAGIFVSNDAHLDAENVSISDSVEHGMRMDGARPRGMRVSGLEIDRVAVTGISARDLGLFELDRARISGAGTFGIELSRDFQLAATRLRIDGNLTDAKAGLEIKRGAEVTLDDFEIERAASIGVEWILRIELPEQINKPGFLRLKNGVIRGHPTGLHIIGGERELSSILDRVSFIENTRVATQEE